MRFTVYGFAVFGLVGLAVYARLYVGIDFSDESYYAALPYSFSLGHRPMQDELAIHQFAGLMLVPAVELYVRSVGSVDGLILFLRHLYFACALVCAAVTTRSLGRVIGRPGALGISAVGLAYIPFNLPSLSYNTIASLGLFAGLMLVAFCCAARRPARDLFAGTLLLASASIAYPPVLLAALVAVGASTRLLYRRSGYRDLRPALIAVALAGAIAGAFVLAVFVRYDGVVNLPRMLQLNAAIGAQGGGVGKLARIGWEAGREAPMAVAFALVIAGAALVYHFVANRLAAIALLGLTFPLLVYGSRFYQPVTEPYSTATFFISLLALASPVALWRMRGRPFAPELWIVASCSLLAGVCIVWATANGLRNLALGFTPAALAGLVAFVAPPRQDAPGARDPIPLLLAFVAAVSLFQVQELYRRIYRDLPISRYDAIVEQGAYAGLATTAARASFIGQLQADLAYARGESETILFFDYFPSGYLHSSLRPMTPALWMFSSNPRYQGNKALRHYYARHYAEGRPLPDIVVRMHSVDLGSWRMDVREPLSDPIRSRFSQASYVEFLRRDTYTILKKRDQGGADGVKPSVRSNSLSSKRDEEMPPPRATAASLPDQES